MAEISKLLHVGGAIVWLGGMCTVLWAVRPALIQLTPPEVRLPLPTQILGRFFGLVWACVVILLSTGGWLLGQTGGRAAPLG